MAINNKRILKAFPKATLKVFRTKWTFGWVGKNVPLYFILPSPHSKFYLGSGYSEREAWQAANYCLKASKRGLMGKVTDERLEME